MHDTHEQNVLLCVHTKDQNVIYMYRLGKPMSGKFKTPFDQSLWLKT